MSRYPLVLLAIVLALSIALGIAPPDRLTWALENSLTAAALVFLIATRRRIPFTNTAYTLIFAFTVLHVVGAHYTYTLVPYDDWCAALSGRTLNSVFGWQRNHYDRFVHTSFGLLLALPMRELFLATVGVRGLASFVLPVQMTLSWSALYELLEWAAALTFGGEASAAYVGMQGDVWDAQKDMALAGSGAVLAMLATAFAQRSSRHAA